MSFWTSVWSGQALVQTCRWDQQHRRSLPTQISVCCDLLSEGGLNQPTYLTICVNPWIMIICLVDYWILSTRFLECFIIFWNCFPDIHSFFQFQITLTAFELCGALLAFHGGPCVKKFGLIMKNGTFSIRIGEIVGYWDLIYRSCLDPCFLISETFFIGTMLPR